MAKERLDRERVLKAALSVLNELGVDGLTMRALAKALDVQAPTLYWHFPSKQALLEAMADAIVAPVALGAPPSDAVENLRALAHELRAALLAYRDGARAFAGTYVLGDNVLRIAERAVGAFLAAGIPADEASHRAFNLVYYVLGCTIEQQAFREQWSGQKDRRAIKAKFAALSGERFPALRSSIDTILSNDFDTRFEMGVEAHLGAAARAGRQPPIGKIRPIRLTPR